MDGIDPEEKLPINFWEVGDRGWGSDKPPELHEEATVQPIEVPEEREPSPTPQEAPAKPTEEAVAQR